MKRQKGEDTTLQKDKNNTTLIWWICAASFLGNSFNFLQFIESSNVFPDKLVCLRKYKNKQAWLMTRVKAWKGQNTGRKSVICLTLALTQKVIRLQEVLLGMTGQSICKNNNNGDDNVATEKNGTKPNFLFIWCPSRRWSHFNSSTTKVLQLSHFPSVKLHLSIMMNFIWKPKGIPSPYV